LASSAGGACQSSYQNGSDKRWLIKHQSFCHRDPLEIPEAFAMNRPDIELTPGSWTNFKGFHGKLRNRVQAKGGQALSGLLETLLIERMEQNEDIFARFMNERDFQGLVSEWISRQV
jgi:hypothetical protein